MQGNCKKHFGEPLVEKGHIPYTGYEAILLAPAAKGAG